MTRTLELLDSWQGKLTWDLFLDSLAGKLGHRYTKVAMLNRPKIRDAWNLAKARARKSAPGVQHGDVIMKKLQEENVALRNRLERVERENSTLIEQFVRWSHNAARAGMEPDLLDRPLPPIDRGSSRKKK